MNTCFFNSCSCNVIWVMNNITSIHILNITIIFIMNTCFFNSRSCNVIGVISNTFSNVTSHHTTMIIMNTCFFNSCFSNIVRVMNKSCTWFLCTKITIIIIFLGSLFNSNFSNIFWITHLTFFPTLIVSRLSIIFNKFILFSLFRFLFISSNTFLNR